MSDELQENQDHENAETLTLSRQLLRLHDDLNNMLARQEFFGVAMSALINGEDGDVLYTERQRSGMMCIARQIRESGNDISGALNAIRKQVGAYLG